MNVSPITVLAPNAGAPASREPAQSADLFADLLRAPASESAPKPVVEPNHAEPRPAAEAKPAAPAERPAPKPRDDVGGGDRTREAEPCDGDETANSETQETGADDGGEADSGAEAKTNSGADTTAQAAVNAAAGEIAAAVLALIGDTETKAPAEIGALAANTAVTAVAAAAAAAAPAVAVKPVLDAAAPQRAEDTPADETQQAPVNSSKAGPAPVQVTVMVESKALVSRPAASLTAAHAQDAADAPVEPEIAAAKPALNAAVAPDERTATQGEPGKDGGGKTAPVQDPALNLAADPAKAADVSAPVRQAADKPAQPVQTQAAVNPSAAAPVYAAVAQTAAPAASVALADRPAPSPAITGANIDHVALQLGKAAADGMDRISIQLKPEAMGRIDVQLQVHSDGRIHAAISADRQDTLDLLQRDARSLERALNDAGLRADAGSLSFNLNGRGQDNGTGAPSDPQPAVAGGPDMAELSPIPAAQIAAYNAAAARGGIDIRV